MEIRSLQNKKVKLAVSLRERRSRDKTGQFLIEGYREILRAIDAGRVIEALFICPDFFLGENEQALIAKAGGEILESSKEVFQKIPSYGKVTFGKRFLYFLWKLQCTQLLF